MFDIIINILACAGTAFVVAFVAGSVLITALMIVFLIKCIKDD